jgi:tetratricopeptide (TPR) repeat protein
MVITTFKKSEDHEHPHILRIAVGLPRARCYGLRGGAIQGTARQGRFPKLVRPSGAGALPARSGDTAAAEKDVQELARLRDTLKTAKNEYWATEVEVSRLGAAAWKALAQGKPNEALSLMQSAADIEDRNEKHIVTPGRIVPARELLGEMLLELKRPVEALKEFEASHLREPERLRGYYGAAQAAAQSGDQAKAKRYFARLAEVAGQGTARPELAQARAFLAANP